MATDALVVAAAAAVTEGSVVAAVVVAAAVTSSAGAKGMPRAVISASSLSCNDQTRNETLAQTSADRIRFFMYLGTKNFGLEVKTTPLFNIICFIKAFE